MFALIPISWFGNRSPYLTLLLSILIFGIATWMIPNGINIGVNAVHRCCFYTPVLVVGYVAAKESWISRIPQLPTICYLLAAILLLIARCMISSIKGFTADTIFAPLFVFSIVAYLNKSHIAEWIKISLERLGTVSMYMWFIHAIFYSDYTRTIFQNSPLWVNNPFISFVIITIVSYLLAELTLIVGGKISIKPKTNR